MRTAWLFCTCLMAFPYINLAQPASTYMQPPEPLLSLIDAPGIPGFSPSPDNSMFLILDRPGYPSIDELNETEWRLAGIRFNPDTWGPTQSAYFSGISIGSTARPENTVTVEGLPGDARIRSISWSPDSRYVAFSLLQQQAWRLWLLDVEEHKARQLPVPPLNDVLPGSPFEWISNTHSLLIRTRPAATMGIRAPEQPTIPAGPVIIESAGEVVSNRTFQDLLQNPHDGDLFEFYTGADLVVYDLNSAAAYTIIENTMVWYASASPDGQFVLVNQLTRPFSYQVPYFRFPQQVEIYEIGGRKVYAFEPVPLAERIPQGFGATRMGPRNWSWQNNDDATITWVEALDGGDPRAEAEHRDAMFALKAPFSDAAIQLALFELRFSHVRWAANGMAVTREREWRSRREIERLWNFSGTDPANYSSKILNDRSYEDRYNDPGNPVTTADLRGTALLQLNNDQTAFWRSGIGASPEGNRPFIALTDFETGQTELMWASSAEFYERVVSIVNDQTLFIIREAPDHFPNYAMLDRSTPDSFSYLTFFANPFAAMEGIQREYIEYSREDGVPLNGTLYLPPGYNAATDGPLPLLMWAYPREFRDAGAAGQRTDAPLAFVRPSWASPIPYTLMGYAVFNNFSMPVIGEGDNEPNDSFVDQISMAAKAAIDTLVNRGIADRSKIAVGGHSYGAFMTANLLAHTDYFAAGIARSGAYNRTLTPFGFQSEERTYWQTPEVYNTMSPFMHAHNIKAPILLIHGDADNNSGTFPMQSERFYAALQSQGANARLVMLPYEGHGYRARESVLHVVWETYNWLETHLQNNTSGREQ